jgi:hypothetical protein
MLLWEETGSSKLMLTSWLVVGGWRVKKRIILWSASIANQSHEDCLQAQQLGAELGKQQVAEQIKKDSLPLNALFRSNDVWCSLKSFEARLAQI